MPAPNPDPPDPRTMTIAAIAEAIALNSEFAGYDRARAHHDPSLSEAEQTQRTVDARAHYDRRNACLRELHRRCGALSSPAEVPQDEAQGNDRTGRP